MRIVSEKKKVEKIRDIYIYRERENERNLIEKIEEKENIIST